MLINKYVWRYKTEYRNVYIKHERDRYARVSNGTDFEIRPKKKIIEQLIEEYSNQIRTYVEDNSEQYLDDLDDTIRQDIEDELVCMLVNMGKKYKIGGALL